ncbi:MAG TPA: NAD(P)/FAD-dependent oxidoreductase [Egicoccus sp.]|nr:NAD(P)/FAD-dependent oxidoreductase [Egicoccus sp.]HSK21736.1 NAD(P)/FAD-dependent oxidoreductase [Egicoccus sp.]
MTVFDHHVPRVFDHDVLIVGAGFSGLGAAIQLMQHGFEDLVVLDRGDDVGGTWRDNTYPGAACDVPSHVYSFSFAPNPNWSRSFSPQAEIHAYLRKTALEWGVLPKLRLRRNVTDATWDAAALRWVVTTDDGETYRARILVVAAGPLSEPTIPDIPGLDTFPGTIFHSATWDHDHDLAGRRVAVVGTGASAIQFTPHVAREAAHTTVFQRTPAWIVPRADRDLTAAETWLFRNVPATQKLARAGDYWLRESYVLGFAMDTRILRIAEQAALRHLRTQVPDPDLRAALTPNYRLGCKRVLISNDFYPALLRDDVDLVASGVGEVRGDTVIAADGSETRADTIVFGTGFEVTRPPIAERIHDGDGRSLATAWEDGMRAYLGTQAVGFPNLFFMVGPNTGLGHNSIIFMAEAQIRYLVSAMQRMRAAGVEAVEVRPEVEAAWDERVQQQLEGTVWTSGGCASWYLDPSGRNSTLWPRFTWQFRRRTASFDLDEQQVVAPTARPVPAPPAAARAS